MAERLKARPELLDQRREIVEHPFGTIKHWMDQGAFLMRGLENVRAEFSLTALAYNLRRAINILGVGPLIAAIQSWRPLVLSVTTTRGEFRDRRRKAPMTRGAGQGSASRAAPC